MSRWVGTGGEGGDLQLSPLLSVCNCLKIPKFVIILRCPWRLQGAEGLVQREELHLPTNHPCLPQDEFSSCEFSSVPISQRRNREAWDFGFIGKE